MILEQQRAKAEQHANGKGNSFDLFEGGRPNSCQCFVLTDEAQNICQAPQRHQNQAENAPERAHESCRGGNSAQQAIHGTNDDQEISSSVPERIGPECRVEFGRREELGRAASAGRMQEARRRQNYEDKDVERAASRIATSTARDGGPEVPAATQGEREHQLPHDSLQLFQYKSLQQHGENLSFSDHMIDCESFSLEPRSI